MTVLQSLLDRLVRLQRTLGLWPLWLFAAFHAWVHWPALLSREAWLARVEAHAPGDLVAWTALAWIMLYVVLGLVRAVRARAEVFGSQRPAGGPSRELIQAWTGVCIACFVVYHLVQVWPRSADTHAAWDDTYQVLWDQLGRTGPLILYVVGCAAFALHLAFGAWRVLGARLPKAWRMPLGIVVGVLGLWVFVSYLQLVARFATGVPLLS